MLSMSPVISNADTEKLRAGMSQEWTDSNMRWNTTEYNNVKDIRVPPNNLWKPDILMYNRYTDNNNNIIRGSEYNI